jgi:hypothetical protein
MDIRYVAKLLMRQGAVEVNCEGAATEEVYPVLPLYPSVFKDFAELKHSAENQAPATAPRRGTANYECPVK